MTPLQTWVKKRGRGALSEMHKCAIKMGTDLSWTTIIRAHRRGGVQLPTAELISKICRKLDKKSKEIPPLSMMVACDPPPDEPKSAKKKARKKK